MSTKPLCLYGVHQGYIHKCNFLDLRSLISISMNGSYVICLFSFETVSGDFFFFFKRKGLLRKDCCSSTKFPLNPLGIVLPIKTTIILYLLCPAFFLKWKRLKDGWNSEDIRMLTNDFTKGKKFKKIAILG